LIAHLTIFLCNWIVNNAWHELVFHLFSEAAFFAEQKNVTGATWKLTISSRQTKVNLKGKNVSSLKKRLKWLTQRNYKSNLVSEKKTRLICIGDMTTPRLRGNN
jgi:hypothetical protein